MIPDVTCDQTGQLVVLDCVCSHGPHDAELTPEQADYLANQLQDMASAIRSGEAAQDRVNQMRSWG